MMMMMSPDTREIFRLRASQFTGPRDSTAVGWKMYWSSSALYFAANSVTAPAEAVADYR